MGIPVELFNIMPRVPDSSESIGSGTQLIATELGSLTVSGTGAAGLVCDASDFSASGSGSWGTNINSSTTNISSSSGQFTGIIASSANISGTSNQVSNLTTDSLDISGSTNMITNTVATNVTIDGNSNRLSNIIINENLVITGNNNRIHGVTVNGNVIISGDNNSIDGIDATGSGIGILTTGNFNSIGNGSISNYTIGVEIDGQYNIYQRLVLQNISQNCFHVTQDYAKITGNIMINSIIGIKSDATGRFTYSDNQIDQMQSCAIQLNSGSVVNQQTACIITNNIFSGLNTGGASPGAIEVRGSNHGNMLICNNVLTGSLGETNTFAHLIWFENQNSFFDVRIGGNVYPSQPTTALVREYSHNYQDPAPSLGTDRTNFNRTSFTTDAWPLR